MGIQQWNYVGSSNDNYGTNSMAVEIGPIVFYFSYQTIVAFSGPGEGLTVSENLWGPTTGRHIGKIQGAWNVERLPREEFEAKLKELTRTLDRAVEGTVGFLNNDVAVIVSG